MSQHTPPQRQARMTAIGIRAMKGAARRIVAITAYDAAFGRLVDDAGVDLVLVGDSVGTTALGYDSTLPVTMDDMVRHTAAVSRGVSRALVVADMPFMSYQADVGEAVRNAGRLVAEGGAQAVKLEGGRSVAPTVARIVEAGIPVCGHLGLTPQSVHAMGGYKVQARETVAALRLLDECRALAEAGAFAVVLECIPAELAQIVSQEIEVPTIGIGAGAGCDGEVQVLHDLLGLGDWTPRHAQRFAEIGEAVREAVGRYAEQVRSGQFPGEPQCTHMDASVTEELRRAIAPRDGAGE